MAVGSSPTIGSLPTRRPFLFPGGVALLVPVVLFGLAYFGLALVSSMLVGHGGRQLSIWLPGGLYVATLLLHPPKSWPLFLMAAFAASGIWDIRSGQSIITSVLISCGDSMAALSGAALVRKFVGARPRLETMREVLGFVCCGAVIPSLVSAMVIAVLWAGPADPARFMATGLLAWGSHVVGTLVLAPIFFGRTMPEALTADTKGAAKRVVEGIVLFSFVALVAAGALSLEREFQGGMKYVVIPVVALAAARFGVRGAAFASLLVAAQTTWDASRHLQPGDGTPWYSIRFELMGHLFQVVTALTSLFLAALLTERRSAEQRLRKSDAKARALMESPNSLSILLTPNGEILDANERLARMFEKTRDTLVGRSFWELLPESRRTHRQAAFRRAVETRVPTRHEDEVGSTVYDHFLTPVTGDDGQVESIAWVSWDITEQKAREAEVRRLNQLYAALNHVNQATVRVQSRGQLFEQVCRVLVTDGPFRSAWIGWQTGNSENLAPVAHCEKPSDTPDQAWVLGADPFELKGPAITAFREGRTAIARDFTGSNRPPLPATAGDRAGSGASAAVPLRQEGRVCGVLNVHAPDPRYFGDRELLLLEEVAAGMEFALDHLEEEAQRRYAEVALASSRSELAAVYEFAPIMMCLLDETQRIVRLNRAAVEFTGQPEPDFIGRGSGDLIGCLHAMDDPRGCGFGSCCGACALRMAVLDTITTGQTHSGIEAWPKLVYGRENKDRCFMISSARVTVEGKIRVLLCIEDVTPRKQAERQLHESEGRFRHFFESLNDYCYMVSPEGLVLDVNPAALRALGYTRQELIGAPVGRLYAPEHYSFLENSLAQLREGKSFHNEELTIVCKSGDHRVVLLNAVPVRDEAGQVIRSASVQTDITERKRLWEQVRQAQKMDAIGQLAGGVAHDFNNVLAASLMHLGVLRNHPHLDANTREGLKELEAETQRAAALSRQLLLFSRRSAIQVRTLNLNETIDRLLKMIHRLVGERHQVEWRPDPDLARVEGDVGLLEQVVVNLAVNARDAMPDGGRLVLSTQGVEIRAEDPDANPESRPGSFVRLTVEDTGTGMDAELQQRIFEPFFTTREPGKSVGLGLATVYSIIKQHQGWVEVESRVGQGSTFRVYLPALPPSKSADGSDGRDGDPRGGSETILVVEDELIVRRMVSQCLKMFGYRVLEASNGVQALRIWQEHSREIALLLSDMIMPEGLSGLDLARQLRHERPELRVVIASGYCTDATQHDLPTDADVVFLPKPFDAQTLGAAVRSCLDKANGGMVANRE